MNTDQYQRRSDWNDLCRICRTLHPRRSSCRDPSEITLEIPGDLSDRCSRQDRQILVRLENGSYLLCGSVTVGEASTTFNRVVEYFASSEGMATLFNVDFVAKWVNALNQGAKGWTSKAVDGGCFYSQINRAVYVMKV